MTDTIAPKINTLYFSPKMTGWQRMVFKIYDNVRVKDKARDLLYAAWVDDEWILMELDGKRGMLSHRFDGRIKPGNHKLIIKVTDDRGNVGTLEKTFTL